MENRPLSGAGGAYRLTVQDYELLASSGAFPDDARTELIEGKIYVMAPAHRRHARVHTHLLVRLVPALSAIRSELEVLTGASVAMPPHSEPMPDIAIVAREETEKVASVAAAKLLIEISQSTARADLGRKARVYAANGVPEYWVIDLKRDVIRQHWTPKGTAYANRCELPLGTPIAAVTIAGLTIDTAGLG